MRSPRSTPIRRRSATAVAVVIASAFAVAGCGGDDATSPQAQWASEVCGPLADWKASMTTIAGDFTGGVSRQSLTQKVVDARQVTTDLVEALQAVGPPPSDAGQQVKDEITGFADSARSTVASITTRAEALSKTPSDLATFTAGLGTIASQLGALAQEAKATLGRIDQLDPGGELRSAIADDPACQRLTGDG